jgi:hypothetical protein
MAAGLGFKEFTTGDVLTAADANGYLASQVVMVFASAAARTSAIASPQEGMISYLKDTNSTEYYSGSAWVAIGGTPATPGLTFITGTTFSAVSSVSLPNSTFTSTYTNYLIAIQINSTTSSGATDFTFRMRASGTDNTSSNYSWSRGFYFGDGGSNVTGSNGSGVDSKFIVSAGTPITMGHSIIDLLSPQAAQKTQFNAKTFANQPSTLAIGGNSAGHISVTTAYDAITFAISNGNMTGSYKVYGYSNS